MNGSLAADLIEQIDRKIDEHANGDTERLMLMVMRETYKNVVLLNRNPAVKFGVFCQSNPKIAWLAFTVAWLISAATVTLAIAEFADKTGIVLGR